MSNKQQSSIDDRIQDLLTQVFEWGVNAGKIGGDKVPVLPVAQIKQAFADEEKGETFKAVGGGSWEKMMTGPEWYEKFRIEFRKLAPMSYAKDFYAKKAAQNVAGIKDD